MLLVLMTAMLARFTHIASPAPSLRDQHATRAQLAGAANLGSPRPRLRRHSEWHSFSQGCRLMCMARHNWMR